MPGDAADGAVVGMWGMHAIRAAHAFDGTQFLPGAATVLVDGGRIASVHTGRIELRMASR